MRTPHFYEKGADVEEYLATDLQETLRTIYTDINRNVMFDKNFFSQTIRVTVAATATLVIVNPLRDKTGLQVEPNAWFVIDDSGNRYLAKGSTWNENQISFKNLHASLSATCDIVIMKSVASNIREYS